MAEQQGQFQTRTTVLSQTQVQPEIRYDPSYFGTVPGLIKITLIIFNFIGFVCVQISAYKFQQTGELFSAIALFGFWGTALLLILHVFHALEKYQKTPWFLVECAFSGFWTILYFASATSAAVYGRNMSIVASLFGFCCLIGYGFDTFKKYQYYRANGITTFLTPATVQQF